MTRTGKGEPIQPSVRRLVDFLAELGPRWGLPAEPCRVHGYLYLMARPVSERELAQSLGLEPAAVSTSLDWLSEFRLAAEHEDGWRTASDPWELMLRALEERRRREMEPALALLRECHGAGAADDRDGRQVTLQVAKLLKLVEDLAAIDMQVRRLSPEALRRMVGLGGRAARFMDRALGKGEC
jgi:DNA-binding transcriptional regulator GbsR (MarR family)